MDLDRVGNGDERPRPMHRVFVYGTLKRGFPYHDARLKGQPFLGRCRTHEPMPLVVAGRWFNPVLIREPGAGHRVFGEAYEVSDPVLAALDRLEGTDLAIGYERTTIAVECLADGAIFEAWTYVKDRAGIDVIHAGPMEEYHLDPNYVPASRRRP